MVDDDHAVLRPLHVDFGHVRAVFDGALEGEKRVLGRMQRSGAVRDDEKVGRIGRDLQCRERHCGVDCYGGRGNENDSASREPRRGRARCGGGIQPNVRLADFLEIEPCQQRGEPGKTEKRHDQVEHAGDGRGGGCRNQDRPQRRGRVGNPLDDRGREQERCASESGADYGQ